MEHVVRCYCINENDEVLLAKAASWQLWSLPWGHIEEWETAHDALRRELDEEFGVDCTVVWSEPMLSMHTIATLPLPIAMYIIQYEHRTRWYIQRVESLYFARCDWSEVTVQEDEIYDYTWMPIDDLLGLKAWEEIYGQYIDILDQNVDLLELL